VGKGKGRRASKRTRALGFLGRLRRAGGMLISREIAVITNAIAFNFLMCLFPLMVVVLAVSQQTVRARGVITALELVLRELIPFGHDAIALSLRNITKAARGLELFSLLLIVWGSSGIFMPVEMALNKAWGGRLHRDFWKSRLLAFVMTMAGGLLVLGSVALTVAARAYGKQWPLLAGSAAKASALIVTTLLFFLIYRVVPGAPVGTRVAAKAALWAGVTWEAIKYGFIVKLGQMNLEAFYGPLAFAAALLLWAYVSSLVLVFGALMSPIQPDGAVREGADAA
jgi:membrane protein/epoxyqueuosine reductase